MDVMLMEPQSIDKFLSAKLTLLEAHIYVHILTKPFLDYLAQMPAPLKERSEIYLDGNKEKINNYAVKKLRHAQFRNVWYINKLHVKLVVLGPLNEPNYIIIGSENLTFKSLSNYELMVLFVNPDSKVAGQTRNFINSITKNKYEPVLSRNAKI